MAERADCSEGLIHRYFGGKRGLLLSILDHKADELVATLEASMPERASLHDEVEQMVLSAMETYWAQRDFMRVCVSQAAIDGEVGRAIGERVNGARVAFLGERLRGHQAAGRVAADVDVEAVALAISGLNIALGFFAQVAFAMDRAGVRAVARSAAAVIERGIAARGELARGG